MSLEANALNFNAYNEHCASFAWQRRRWHSVRGLVSNIYTHIYVSVATQPYGSWSELCLNMVGGWVKIINK